MDRSEAIRRQVAKILASPAFARANRSSQLLAYLVESTLNGHQDELKEYNIATQAFGKPETFDPRIDTLVRVEATRLRNRLQTYFQSATDADEIEIILAPGTYVPSFNARNSPELPGTPVPPAASARRGMRWGWAAAAILAIIFGVVLVQSASRRTAPPTFKVLRRLSIPDEVMLFPGLSPDGNRVYFSSNRGGGGLRIWSQTWDGKSAEVMTPADSDAYDLDVSPDGKWLAYWSSRQGGSIYQQRSSGGGELRVTAGARSPRFSPDGTSLIFWKEGTRGTFGAVFKSGITPGVHGRDPVPVASDFDDAHNPQWTPDMRVLLCGTRKTNVPQMEHDLWIIDLNEATTGVAPLKTGILPFLREREIILHPRPFTATSFRLHGRDLIFSGMHKGIAKMYRLALSSAFHADGEPVLLDDTNQAADNPSIRDSLLTFSTQQTNLNIWTIPLDSNGRSNAPPRRLTQDPGEEFFPAISEDGRWLHYIAARQSGFELWRKDLTTGVEGVTLRFPEMRILRMTPDGSLGFFRALTGGYPQRQTIYRVDPATGASTVACDDCGSPTSVSSQGKWIAFETGSRLNRIAVLDSQTGARSDILSHPHSGLQAARISPDGKGIAFELDKGVDGKQIIVAPFRGMSEIAETAWMPITQEGFSFEPAWNSAGTAVYFISDRLGSRDLWMQRVDASSKRPVEDAVLVYRFRNANQNPLTYSDRSTRYIGLSVAHNQALLTVSELSASIQLGRLE